MFTKTDRRRIQVALNLPVTEVQDGSDLAIRMANVERFDQEQGTVIVADILAALAALEDLDAQITLAYQDGSAAAATASFQVDEYRETLSFGAGNRSLGSGFIERRGHYIHAIERDLGYGSGAMGGRIPVM
jgi:hypothetical protein